MPLPATPFPDRSAGRRRSRRGRGPRGVLVPPPVARGRTRAAVFDRHVQGALARLERAWSEPLSRVEVRVEDIPMTDPATWETGGVPLADAFGRSAGQPDRIVLYRRPIEERAEDEADMAVLVLDILVEQLAQLLGRRPDEIDPGYEL